MSFAEPSALLGLVLVPLLLAFYVWGQRRRRRYTLRYSSLMLVREAATRASPWRRHAPAALYLLAISTLFVASARPQATVPDPESSGTVVLAIDVSGSMRATDVAPSRIDAAKAAVRTFVSKQPKGVRIGVVAFSAGAVLVTPPTEDRKQVLAAVSILPLTRGTNIGDGLRVAFEALSSSAADDPLSSVGGPPAAPPVNISHTGKPLGTIVLLSDGSSTTGPNPLEIARQISLTGIKAHTVGLGTVQGGSFGFGGPSMRLDETTLKGIADLTGGEYFSAKNSKDLHQIYRDLAKEGFVFEKEIDVTFLFGGAALLILLAGLAMGSIWSSKLP